jgi:hypothetical protein
MLEEDDKVEKLGRKKEEIKTAIQELKKPENSMRIIE